MTEKSLRRRRRVERWSKRNAADLLVAGGLLAAAVGFGLVYLPLMLILGGLGAVVLGVLMERR